LADYQSGIPILINDTFRVAGVETNPTQVVYSILGPDGTVTTYTWPGSPAITNTGPGVFQLALSPPSPPGLYSYDVDATGTVVASRTGSFNILANLVTGVDVPWAVPGPCAPWTSSQAAWNCCGQPVVIVDAEECPVDFSAQVQMASEILFELSGRLYSAGCEKTVRPCRTGSACGVQILSRGHIIAPWGWTGMGWSDPNYCGCAPLDRVLLPGYPVREILEVKIDGDVVDPDTYKLFNWRWLVRVRDPDDPGTALGWPSCQTLDLEDTEDGTFSVTYRYGQDPPIIGQHAAAALACELYRACGSGDGSGGECAIPANVTRLTRQGVTIDKNATIAWFFGLNQIDGWQTGMTLVDSFLNSFNRSGIQQRPRTWSPDGEMYAKAAGI
jgi:hypothetical protein